MKIIAVLVRLNYTAAVPFCFLIIKKVNVSITAYGFGRIAVYPAAVACKQFETIDHAKFRSYFCPWTAVIGIVKICLVNVIWTVSGRINCVEEKISLKVNFIFIQCCFLHYFVIAVAYCCWIGISSVFSHIYFLCAIISNINTYISVLKLECRKSCMIARFHAFRVKLNNTAAWRSLCTLGEGVSCVQYIWSYRIIMQPEKSVTFCNAPCGIVRIMIPLPFKCKIIADVGKTIVLCKMSSGITAVNFNSQRSFTVYAHHREAVFPRDWNKHRYSSDRSMILKQ